MDVTADRVIAVVGLGAVLPDARNVKEFWDNVTRGRYSISDVPADRWDPALFFDPDPKAPDKTYSRIGGWVRECEWDPVKWKLPIPPRVSDAMDWTQKWAIGCTLQALTDFGYPTRALDLERTAVILGNAMGGEQHNRTTLRTAFPEYARELEMVPAFASLPADVRDMIRRDWRASIGRKLPPITEDSMPGELSNCIAGRLANLFNFRGPNFVADAACASAMAAMSAAVEGLIEKRFDTVITGGVDRNMGASTFIKFCKIGALSATGSRPYADGADGFVMGEGAAIFLMKRLADAERDGDRIYAVLRGIGGSSDGKGKGITAPNPVGQRLAVSRAWENAGLSPSGVGLIEGHGTSTAVGDLVEVESLIEVFGKAGCKRGSVALGSVKSNIGHLKSAAGAVGVLKAVLALHEKVLPPTVKFHTPNAGVDFDASPFRVATDLRPWELTNGHPRQVGVSAFGFGGTNFHVVLEEHVPGRFVSKGRSQSGYGPADGPAGRAGGAGEAGGAGWAGGASTAGTKAPLRGALLLGAATAHDLAERLRGVLRTAQAGEAAAPSAPAAEDLQAAERVSIDYANAAELADKASRAIKALDSNAPAMWKALRAQGIFRGRGPRGKIAFLYTGQGSQYLNMLETLRRVEPIVAETFAEADRHTIPLLGRPISEFLFIDPNDKAATERAEEELRQTAITQPAVLTVDFALTRLLAAYGVAPDMVMGHSLGEYGALVAGGAMPFRDALEAVSARGREMTRVSIADTGWMVAVFAPLAEIERIVAEIGGNVVIANINSTRQAVIGGPSAPVEQAMKRFLEAGYTAMRLPVSHAFHTAIVAPATGPMREQLQRLHLEPPHIPIVSNVTGKFYPMGPGVVPEMVELLAKQIASPVQFVRGLQTLVDAGATLFVETGPKKALQGFAEEAFADRADVLAVFTNHPKFDDLAAFNVALCGAYAMGHGTPKPAERPIEVQTAWRPLAAATPAPAGLSAEQVMEIGRVFASAIEHGLSVYHGAAPQRDEAPVVVTGASIGLPGTPRVFDDGNVARILNGEIFIKAIPDTFRKAMAEKRVTRLVKSSDGMPRFETIDDTADVVKLAARAGELDLAAQFGVPADRLPAFDPVTRLAIGAGLDALRDAGIPLVQHYKTTTRGTMLPDRWGLPDALRDDTGIIFTSAFPGLDSYTDIIAGYYRDRLRREKVQLLEELRAEMNGEPAPLRDTIERRLELVAGELDREPYVFDRRFLLRVLSMGHSQFAELIGARGPNTQINAACASSTMALGMAEDWIRAGRCRRVIIVGADNITSDNLMEWFGAGFLASGAAATDERVEDAALPFDRRRHGLLIGMGAAGVVVESADAVKERGLQPICQVIETVSGNSAFHGTRLDVQHIAGLMETLVARVEAKTGVSRQAIAARLLFVSHETYTPARGGSASAEVTALRRVFGDDADKVIVANSKGYTGHPMAVGIEDVLAVKSLETGIVPPVAHYKELDPELGPLNLSQGGKYPVEWAMRLGAGFGSQISLSVMRWTPVPDGVHRAPDQLGYAYRVIDQAAWSGWLRAVSGQTSPQLEVDHRTLRVKDQPVAVTSARPAIAAAVAPKAAPVAQPAGSVVARSVASVVAPDFSPVTVDPIKDKILALVVEKTGYPAEMLDFDLDLEADLGVDTVKQAELMAAIRSIYEIPRDDRLKLRDFPTLNHVIKFVYDRRPDLKAIQEVRKSDVPPAPPVVPEAAVPVMTADPVKDKILALVVEKTGYPAEMLDLDLDLEADLGVDTVKQAELMAAIRGIYEIPRDDRLKLRDFPTLNHVINFVYDRRPDLKAIQEVRKSNQSPALSEHHVPPRVEGPVLSEHHVPPRVEGPALSERDAPLRVEGPALSEHQVPPRVEGFDAANRIPRRVPIPVVRPPLSFCKPTGVTLETGRRVIVMTDHGGAAAAVAQQLGSRGVVPLVIDEALADDRFDAQVADWLSAGPISGVYWLPALDHEADVRAMTPDTWRESLRVRVKLLYRLMRALYVQMDQDNAFLVAATRCGGQHGYDTAGSRAVVAGAVTGFTKAFKRERTRAMVKVVDFGEQAPAEIAALLVDETLRDPGVVEVGYCDGVRCTIGLSEQAAADGQPGMTFSKDTVFVVTGAAGSIVSAIVTDLAAASGGVFYLFDRVPEPDPADPDLARFADDKEGLKRDIAARMKARGERATPVVVERELAAVERSHAALQALQAVEQCGGIAVYTSVDLTDPVAVERAIDTVREQNGRIDVLVHAAGIEISRFLPEKEAAEFERVLDVKATGWFNLLKGIGDMPLGAGVVFSSIAGRFGNGGQTDYSAANDLLCKSISNFRRSRPDTRGIAVDWTAWSGIGMASRGSIPRMMEMAGIDMLPPEAGVPVVRRELTTGGTSGEIVIAGRLGIMLEDLDAVGVDHEAPAMRECLQTCGPMIGRIEKATPSSGLIVETTLDPRVQPFLFDHQIDGTPVLPGVMGVEAFAELARLLVPDHYVIGIDDVQFHAAFKFFRHEPRPLRLHAQLVPHADGVSAYCRLIGTRVVAVRQAHGASSPSQGRTQAEPQETVHFTARVRLARAPLKSQRIERPAQLPEHRVGAPDIYRLYFHGPAYQVVESAWRHDGVVVGRFAADLPPQHVPSDRPTLVAPRLLELCLQTAGLWDCATKGRLSLPHRIDHIAAFQPVESAGTPLFAVVRADESRQAFDADVVDSNGHLFLRVRGYQTVEIPGDFDDSAIKPLSAALSLDDDRHSLRVVVAVEMK